MGYCPQFDAQFETLTAREHLSLYASIKVCPTTSSCGCSFFLCSQSRRRGDSCPICVIPRAVPLAWPGVFASSERVWCLPTARFGFTRCACSSLLPQPRKLRSSLGAPRGTMLAFLFGAIRARGIRFSLACVFLVDIGRMRYNRKPLFRHNGTKNSRSCPDGGRRFFDACFGLPPATADRFPFPCVAKACWAKAGRWLLPVVEVFYDRHSFLDRLPSPVRSDNA